MSKRQGVFTENFTIFFQMQEKLETCWNSNLISSRRTCFGDDINLKFKIILDYLCKLLGSFFGPLKFNICIALFFALKIDLELLQHPRWSTL